MGTKHADGRFVPASSPTEKCPDIAVDWEIMNKGSVMTRIRELADAAHWRDLTTSVEEIQAEACERPVSSRRS